ncbi:MAG TPA: hypothetical protein VNP20_11570 [Nocardioidaceae bacterium]|nr:hypothetical protein [Nocardioidaceae bacterium]
MTKITVYRYGRDNEQIESAGWFTVESAEALPEADPMTAERYAAAMRRGQPARFVRETLYRTEEGRWVLKVASHVDAHNQWVDDEEDAQPVDGMPRVRFLADAEAMEWLTRNGYADRISAFMPDLPNESGPGRPEIGGLVQVRLGNLLPSIDAYAAGHGWSRAEAVRRLVLAGLSRDE